MYIHMLDAKLGSIGSLFSSQFDMNGENTWKLIKTIAKINESELESWLRAQRDDELIALESLFLMALSGFQYDEYEQESKKRISIASESLKAVRSAGFQSVDFSRRGRSPDDWVNVKIGVKAMQSKFIP